jgi:hypothetical protein
MIDISGQVQMAAEGLPEDGGDEFVTSVTEDVMDPVETPDTEPQDFESVQTLEGAEPSSELTNADWAEELDDEPLDSDVQSFDEPEEDLGFSEESDQEADVEFDDESNHEAVEEDLTEESLAEEEPEEVEAFPMPQEPDSAPLDITDYANSQQSALEEGELLYDLTITRIDSKDLREALKYVLLDQKLKINHKEYLRTIRDGRVVIPDLNPVKAKRIVEQLQYLEVGLSWRQKRIVMQVVEPEAEDDFAEQG